MKSSISIFIETEKITQSKYIMSTQQADRAWQLSVDENIFTEHKLLTNRIQNK